MPNNYLIEWVDVKGNQGKAITNDWKIMLLRIIDVNLNMPSFKVYGKTGEVNVDINHINYIYKTLKAIDMFDKTVNDKDFDCIRIDFQ